MKSVFCCAVLMLLLSGCGDQQSHRDYHGIGSISGLDQISCAHIQNLLMKEGIVPIIEGSVIYSVAVEEALKDKAREILIKDYLANPYPVHIYDADLPEYEPLETVVTYNENYEDVLKSDKLPVLLKAALEASDVSEAAQKWPCLEQVSYVERRYFVDTNVYSAGIEAKITLKVSLSKDMGANTLNIMVWDNGSKTQYQGGSYWEGGDPIEEQRRVFLDGIKNYGSAAKEKPRGN